MSVWKTQTSVDVMPTVLTQVHIIPAFVVMDSSQLLEWKCFTMATTLHVETLMNAKRTMFVVSMRHASTHQAVIIVSAMLAIKRNPANQTSLGIRSNVKTFV